MWGRVYRESTHLVGVLRQVNSREYKVTPYNVMFTLAIALPEKHCAFSVLVDVGNLLLTHVGGERNGMIFTKYVI